MIVTLQALKRLGPRPGNARVVIQGFGNVGGMAAKLMARAGFKIVCDRRVRRRGLQRNGLDIAALMQHRNETGSITDLPSGEDIDRDEALFLECDVLLPAATENVITSGECGPPALQDSVRRRQRSDHVGGRRNSARRRRSL